MAVPTRKTSEQELDLWNQQWRSTPLYGELLRSVGANPTGPLSLSKQQRETLMQRLGVPEGMHIDPAGNLNQVNTLGGNLIKGAAIGGAALTGLGAAGIGPMSGLFSSAAAPLAGGSAGAGTSAAAGTIPTLSMMGGTSLSSLGSVLPAVPGLTASGAAGGGMGIGSLFGGIKKGIDWLGKGSDALGTIGRVGEQLTGAAQGSRDARMSDADALLRQYIAQQTGAGQQFNSQLQSAQFAREEQDRQRKAAILSTLLGGMQDFSATPGNPAIASRMPTMSGGARPSALTGNKDALMALLGQAGPSAPTFSGPSMPELPQGGKGESILGALGLGSSLLGAFRKPKAA